MLVGMPTIDLSHPITDGMVTYPGLPGPVLSAHLTREASRERYAPGIEFHIGHISMVGNTGTYLDTPFHRFPDGWDLADLDLDSLAAVPGLRCDGRADGADGARRARRSRRPTAGAVIVRTGWDAHFGTDAYGGPDHPTSPPSWPRRSWPVASPSSASTR